jgi:hypothetical protein
METISEISQKYITLVNDMNTCLAQARIDLMMYSFLHIYYETEEKFNKDTDLKLLHTMINKTLKNKELMARIELYYKVSEGDEGRLLFDPTVADEAIYQLDNYSVGEGEKAVDIFMFIIEMKRLIAVNLGRLKAMILGGDTLSTEF